MKRIRLTSVIFAAMALAAGITAVSASATPFFSKTFSFGVYGEGTGQISSARGMDTDAAGNVWIAEPQPPRVQEFSPTGQYLATITGSGEHKLTNPTDLAIAPDGNIWVLDGTHATEFRPNGEYLRGTSGHEAGRQLAIDSKGNLWLGDPEGQANKHLYKYNSTGVYQKSVEVPLHSDIEVDSNDNVLVVVEGGINKYSSEGSYLGQLGKGVLIKPDSSTIDTEGNVWVVDYTGSGGMVKGFNSKGEYLTQFDPGHSELAVRSMAPALGGGIWISFPTNGNQIEKWSDATGEQLNAMPVTEPFDGGTTSKANFSSNWSKLGWAAEKGSDETTGWRPNAAYPTVAGAYFNSTITDAGLGVAAVATMAVNSQNTGRYFSIWLDASGSAGTREGYELRFTEVSSNSNTYNVTLSLWKAGVQSILASKSSYSFVTGNSLALVDQGNTVSAWTNTGAGFKQLLTATDASFASGKAGIEGAGNLIRLNKFKAGRVSNPPPPETTITGGSAGKVTPDVAFTFNSNEGSASFECALDAGAYAACSSPKSYEGLAEGSHTFKVRAVKSGLVDLTPAERTVEVKDVAKAVAGIAVLDDFERTEMPLANGNWAKTVWAEEIGSSWTGIANWHGYGANGDHLASAYWKGAQFGSQTAGVLASATVGTGSTGAGEYTALWLNMTGNFGTSPLGYEARFTGTNGSAGGYKVELSKWIAGTRTVLGSKEGFSLPVDTTFVLTETGGKVGLWTGTSSFSRVLSAYDTSFIGGSAGIEVYKGNGTVYNFRAGNIQ